MHTGDEDGTIKKIPSAQITVDLGEKIRLNPKAQVAAAQKTKSASSHRLNPHQSQNASSCAFLKLNTYSTMHSTKLVA